jgi:hypothetical protein
MPTKQQAINFAKQFNWTGKDAERAFANIDLQNADEQSLLLALVEFAGPQLAERQRLQGAQKAQVTKKSKYIKEIETQFAERVDKYEKDLKQQQSLFVGLISKIYRFAKPLGLEDPWIEALLAQYNEHQNAA